MSNIVLSICIPTLNRAEYLKGLLENIKSELDSGIKRAVEIVIVDGGSADHTKKVIQTFDKEMNIRSYYRNRREGIDQDILKCVELSNGEYCWLFSDDDRFCESAIRYVVNILCKNENITGAFCNRVPYDKELKKRVHEARQWPCNRTIIEEYLNKKTECFESIGMDLGYLSSQIVNRNSWNMVLRSYDSSRMDGSLYMMVDIIANMMNYEFRWMIINRPLVMQRTGNDSILARIGIIQRQMIEHNGFRSIINLHYRKRDKEYRAFNNKIINRLPRVIANIKSQKVEYIQQLRIYQLHMKKYYLYPALWIKVLPIMLVPNAIFVFIKKIYFRYWI